MIKDKEKNKVKSSKTNSMVELNLVQDHREKQKVIFCFSQYG